MLKWRFDANNTALYTVIGERTESSIRLQDKQGRGLYGPYLDIPAGFCIARILFDGPSEGFVEMDISAEFGQRILASQTFDLGDAENHALGLSVTLNEPASKCEVRLDCHQGVRASISAVEIDLDLSISQTDRRIDNNLIRPRSLKQTVLFKLQQIRGSASRMDHLVEIINDLEHGLDENTKILGKLEREISSLGTLLQRFGFGSRETIARELAEAIAYRGENENALYRAFAGTERPMNSPPAPVFFTSSLCQQCHFLLDQYRFWMKAMKIRPRFSRKDWEWFYIAQTLFDKGFLASGKVGIGFGVGREPLVSLFASFGTQIVATDQSLAGAEQTGWMQSSQYSPHLSVLNERGICTEYMFSQLVSFTEVDMNCISSNFSEKFDFCWSSCSLEHLGSLTHGLNFIENSLNVLKPGGVCVHTTEFNLSSDIDTIETPHVSIYRRRDIQEFLEKMTCKGFVVSPVDWTLGEGFAETVVDLPPFGRGEPHIRLRADYDVTSIGLIIEKPISH